MEFCPRMRFNCDGAGHAWDTHQNVDCFSFAVYSRLTVKQFSSLHLLLVTLNLILLSFEMQSSFSLLPSFLHLPVLGLRCLMSWFRHIKPWKQLHVPACGWHVPHVTVNDVQHVTEKELAENNRTIPFMETQYTQTTQTQVLLGRTLFTAFIDFSYRYIGECTKHQGRFNTWKSWVWRITDGRNPQWMTKTTSGRLLGSKNVNKDAELICLLCVFALWEYIFTKASWVFKLFQHDRSSITCWILTNIHRGPERMLNNLIEDNLTTLSIRSLYAM